MDHLPSIVNVSYAQDKVPCYITDIVSPYTGPDLLDYPQSRGFILGKSLGEDEYDEWSLYPLPDCTLLTDTPAEKGGFLQAWLFFGPLYEVCATVGIPFNARDFVSEVEGERLITTAKLEDLVKLWAETEARSERAKAKAERAARVDEVLQVAQAVTRRNLTRFNVYEPRWALPEIVLVSFQLLHEALTQAWAMIYHAGSVGMGHQTGAGNWGLLSDSRMRTMGWCPSEIAIAQQKLSATGRYFASRLKRRIKLDQPHSSCDEAKCLASQIKADTYVTQHVQPGCSCVHIGVDVDEVRRHLKQGNIPRVRITISEESESLVQVEIEGTGQYVAISHVWAHGLGNENGNSLPNCQLQRLARLATELNKSQGQSVSNDNSILIWIDTLCVPTTEGRKNALRLMHKTYLEAKSVLVLDEELYHESSTASVEEICIRLVLCQWSRRLWTFEEGFLSWSHLFIQFADGPKRYSDFSTVAPSTLHSPLRYECIEAAKGLLPRRTDASRSGKDIISLVTDACKHRTTSRLVDETFCLASTAGLDTSAILQHDSQEERMKAFLTLCKHIPTNVIFFDGPKLQDPGFRWAPRSFLYPLASSTVLSGDRKGVCTAAGLTGRWPTCSLRLRTDVSYHNAETYYFRFNDTWMLITSPETVQRNLHGVDPDEEKLQRFRDLHTVRECTLLLSDVEMYDQEAAIVSVVPGKETENNEAGVQRADFVLKVLFAAYPVDSGVFTPEDLDLSVCIEVEGSVIIEREWCIS